ncbi:MAG: LptF/LptG family permease, partial [Ignavibacteria bacterium]|nr:LptF/LptG family permease [Ignavibacteria bacterium]
FLQDANNRILHLVYYDENSLTATRVSIQTFDSSDLTKLIRRIDCDYIKWDSTKNFWSAFNVSDRIFPNDSINKIFHYDTLALKELNLNPNDILLKQRKVEELNFSELFKVIDEQKRRGNDITKLLIDVHSIFAFSFASLIVVFFGIPLSAEKRRGGIAFQFGVNIFVTFVYLAFMKISQAFGKNGMMNPILTAWFANIVFLIIAVINIIRVKK